MKLFLKITLLYLLLTLVIFVPGGVISYQVMKREIDLEQQRFLKERLENVVRMIERRNLTREFRRDKISVIPLGTSASETSIIFSDTLVMHNTLQRIEPHVKLDVVKKVKDQYYHISLFDLIVEADDIEEGVKEAMVKMYLLLFAVVLVVSWFLSRYILKPFHLTLQKIRDFNIRDKQPLHFPISRISEFQKLNHFLEEMTTKVRGDYNALKEFTENASHEMQTPLSIANGKLELLLESNNLSNEQVTLAISAQDSIRRLSKMSKALSLLTKIENKEFSNIKQINFTWEVEKLLYDFKELIELKNIALSADLKQNVMVDMDPTMAAALITNLLQNAVRHNVENGKIWVSIDEKKFMISNTGTPLTTAPEKLFERFRKDNQSKESLGLGLAIVKKICETHGHHITYHYEEDKHIMRVYF